MITTTVTGKLFEKGSVILQIRIDDDGVEVGTFPFSGISLEQIKSQVRAKIDQITAAKDLYTNIPDGVFDPTYVPPSQTTAEIQKEDWFNRYSKWVHIKYAIDMGILTGSEPQVVTFLNNLKTDLKPAYINEL
jgi:hypothetical protein